jgi:hypothetical protein
MPVQSSLYMLRFTTHAVQYGHDEKEKGLPVSLFSSANKPEWQLNCDVRIVKCSFRFQKITCRIDAVGSESQQLIETAKSRFLLCARLAKKGSDRNLPLDKLLKKIQ